MIPIKIMVIFMIHDPLHYHCEYNVPHHPLHLVSDSEDEAPCCLALPSVKQQIIVEMRRLAAKNHDGENGEVIVARGGGDGDYEAGGQGGPKQSTRRRTKVCGSGEGEQGGGEGGENKRMAKLRRNARSVRQRGDLHSPEHSPSQYELLFGWMSSFFRGMS